MTRHVRAFGQRVRDLVTAARVEGLAARVTAIWDTRLDGNSDTIVLGRFELDRVLGHGTHGVVFAGFDRLLERDVAVKVFRDASERALLREARALARLNHPNIVTLHDAGRADGLLYLVMELVDGGTVGQRARMGLELGEFVDLFVQAGRGLAAAHAAGIVHGDVKPANLLVGRDGRVRVADFGMSRMLGGRDHGESGSSGGTRGYMAPEVRSHGAVDEQADQFSFCAALWKAACGQPAPRADGETEPARRALPAQLEKVLRRGLHEDPRDRYPTIDGVVEELDEISVALAQRWPRAS